MPPTASDRRIEATVSISALSKAVAIARRATRHRGSSMVSTVALYAAAERPVLEASASNGDIAISVDVEADVAWPGELVIPAKPLADTLDRLPPDGTVTLVEDGASVVLLVPEAGVKVHLRRLVEPAAHLLAPKGDLVKLDEELWDAISRVAMAAAVDPSSGVYVGIRFHDGWAMATDTYRGSATPMPDDSLEGIIPASAIAEAARLGDEVQMAIGENSAVVVTDGAIVTSRLIRGTFPDVTASARQAHDATTGRIDIDATWLASAVDLAATVAGGTTVELHIHIDHVTVGGAGAPGSATTRVPAEAHGSAPGSSVVFSHRYLLEALATVAPLGGVFTLRVPPPKTNGRVVGATVAEGAAVDHLLMPTAGAAQ